MAIEWLTVLKSVPWSEVISTAPKVAEGARKLWHAVAGRRAGPADGPAAVAADSADPAGPGVEARLADVEAATRELQGQMLASSELIRALADQNGQLIARLEALRRRVFWLGIALVAGIVLGLVLAGLRPGS